MFDSVGETKKEKEVKRESRSKGGWRQREEAAGEKPYCHVISDKTENANGCRQKERERRTEANTGSIRGLNGFM